jgi:hypothetical protein
VTVDETLGRLVFTPRPAPVSVRLRPAHRVAVLLELIDKCHGSRATLLQLHVLDTALVDDRARRRLRGEVVVEPALSVVRVDPALNRAVDRAIGDALVELHHNATVGFADRGRAALRALRDTDILQEERTVLAEIRGKVTQGQAALAAGAAR